MGRSKKTVVKTEEKKGGGSSHTGKKIGQFLADQMARCLAEIDHYKKRQKELGLVKMEVSMNQIARNHRLSPATVNKLVTWKVTGLGSQLGGARQGNVAAASKFQVIWYLWRVPSFLWVTWFSMKYSVVVACLYVLVFGLERPIHT